MANHQISAAPTPGADALLTIPATCKVMSIGKTLAWELIKTKKLEVVRLGSRCTRVKRSSVDRLISGEAA